jgi:hypothetical protein
MDVYDFIDYFHKTEAERQAQKYKKLVDYLNRQIAVMSELSDTNNREVSVKHQKFCDYPTSAEGMIQTTFDTKEMEWYLTANRIKNQVTARLADLRDQYLRAIAQMNYWNEQVRIEDDKIRQQIAAFLGRE